MSEIKYIKKSDYCPNINFGIEKNVELRIV